MRCRWVLKSSSSSRPHISWARSTPSYSMSSASTMAASEDLVEMPLARTYSILAVWLSVGFVSKFRSCQRNARELWVDVNCNEHVLIRYDAKRACCRENPWESTIPILGGRDVCGDVSGFFSPYRWPQHGPFPLKMTRNVRSTLHPRRISWKRSIAFRTSFSCPSNSIQWMHPQKWRNPPEFSGF